MKKHEIITAIKQEIKRTCSDDMSTKLDFENENKLYELVKKETGRYPETQQESVKQDLEQLNYKYIIFIDETKFGNVEIIIVSCPPSHFEEVINIAVKHNCPHEKFINTKDTGVKIYF